MIKIKKLSINDLPLLDDIEPEFDTSTIIKDIYKLRGYCLLAVKSNIPVGYVLIYPNVINQLKILCIDNVTVRKKYRQLGIGTKLLREAMKRIDNRVIFIFVRNQTWLIKWYERHGFMKITKEIPNLIGMSDNGFIMSTKYVSLSI